MERLWQDIRYGARLLIRFPGVTIAALTALALGTGVNTALFSIVNAVLLTPLPFPDANALVQVWRTELPRLQYGSASYPRYVDWRTRNRVFVEMGAYSPSSLTMTGREAREGFAMSAIGVGLGLGGAAVASQLIRRLLYQVSPTDPLVFALTAAGVALTAILGYVVPAIRAAPVEPAVALRAE